MGGRLQDDGEVVGPQEPTTRPRRGRKWLLVGGVAVLVIAVGLASALRPSRADEFRQLHEDTAAIFTERGDDLPPFFDPDWMDVTFEWADDQAEIHADNVQPRHAEYDPGYEAYSACEWARSWVYRHGTADTDLEIYIDGRRELVLHDSGEDCVSADAD